jgi:NADH-quinone oxidoreductase subunit F
MVFPAGPSAPPLPGSDLDVALDPDVLRARGSGLGTGAVLVIGRTPCPLCVAVSLAGFFEREACGQCPPCVVGSRNLARVVRGLEHGGARAKDLQDAAEVAGFMRDHGYCAHGRTAAAAVTGMLAQERGAVATHLAARGCPHAAAACSPFDPGSPERLAIEATLGARA